MESGPWGRDGSISMKAAKQARNLSFEEEGKRKKERGRRKEEEGRSQKKCFDKYEMLPEERVGSSFS